MAKLCEISPEHQAWIDERPAAIKAMIEKWPPNLLYRLKTTGQRVTLYSYSEDGTITVDVTGKFNFHDFDKRVFGIDPNELEECSLPASDEPIGTMIADAEELEKYIDLIRPGVLAARGLTDEPDSERS